jgi:hypothetical protein
MHKIILAPLAACLLALLATTASAKPRKYVRHHTHAQAQQYVPQFQPVIGRWPDGPVMQPSMMPQPVSQQPRRLTRAERRTVRVNAEARMAFAARPNVSAPDASASAPASFGAARRW